MSDDNRVRIVIFTFLVTFCKGYNPHLSVQLNPCEAEVLRVPFIYFYLLNVKHILRRAPISKTFHKQKNFNFFSRKSDIFVVYLGKQPVQMGGKMRSRRTIQIHVEFQYVTHPVVSMGYVKDRANVIVKWDGNIH